MFMFIIDSKLKKNDYSVFLIRILPSFILETHNMTYNLVNELKHQHRSLADVNIVDLSLTLTHRQVSLYCKVLFR